MKSTLKVLTICAFVVAFIFAGCYIEYGNKQTYTVTVKKTEQVTKATGSGEDLSIRSYYLVFTDKGVFRIEDQLFYDKFNSSDLYGELEAGGTYHITTTGFRSGFLSMYPNIVRVSK